MTTIKHTPFVREKLSILEHWMAERERIRILRSLRKPPPWTEDHVLAIYRFCNVIRMDDRVSKWLMDKWYDRKAKPEQLVVAATIARLINEPRTLAQIPFPHRYDEGRLRTILQQVRMQSGGEAVFGNAYLVVGTEFADGGKVNVLPRIVQRVLEARLFEAGGEPETMQEMHARLMTVNGLGSFLAGQIVADLRHLLPGQFSDPMTWAPVGPGSSRGMRRLMGMEPGRRNGLNQRTFLPLLTALRNVVKVPPSAAKRLEAMDLQNCLCEFDKYSRVAEGRRPRRLYP